MIMKKISIALVVAMLAFCGNAYSAVRFDERLELTSIVCRLAGMPETNNFAYEEYANEVENYFSPYKKHAVVELVADPNNKLTVRDLFELALNFDINRGFILEGDPKFENINRSFATKYLSALGDFYRDSKFLRFYTSHFDYYEEATKIYTDIVKGMDKKVLKKMFGIDIESVNILLNSFSGAYSYSFPDKNIFVYSGFATHYIGNSKQGFLSTTFSAPELRFVYSFAEYALASSYDKLEESTLSASRIYFNLIDNNYFKPRQLYAEYVKNFCAVYYLKTTKNSIADISLKLVAGNDDNINLVSAESLYEAFAPLAKSGNIGKKLKKFTDIYNKNAEAMNGEAR